MGSQSLSSDDRRNNWLVRFLQVQQASDKQVNRVLNEALEDLNAKLATLDGKPGIGAATRRAQLVGNRGVINSVLSLLYKKLGDIVRSGQAQAASSASAAERAEAAQVLMILVPDPAKRKVLQKSLEQTAIRNIQSTMTRVLQTQQPLSKRIYRSQKNTQVRVNRIVNSHLAQGSSAEDMAKDLRRLFNPKVPGGVSYAAKRLARTEINNAFHAQSISDMQDRPWIDQVRWNLSKSHPVKQPHDACDDYARIGLFPPDHVPPKPHPNCFCYVTPDLPDINTLTNDFLAGKFNAWIAANTEDGLRRSA